MNELLSSFSTPEAEWNRLWPVLDEAMHELDQDEREIVLLRFFEKISLADVGERLGLSANTTAKESSEFSKSSEIRRDLDRRRANAARVKLAGATATSSASKRSKGRWQEFFGDPWSSSEHADGRGKELYRRTLRRILPICRAHTRANRPIRKPDSGPVGRHGGHNAEAAIL
jgi:hypothetical protein